MDCVVTPLKTLMGFSVHLNVQLKFYNLPNAKRELMAAAIKEQKKLCVENGVDPDLVNIIGLEKKERNKNE